LQFQSDTTPCTDTATNSTAMRTTPALQYSQVPALIKNDLLNIRILK